MENLLKDIGYSLRSMAKNPGFSLVACLTLAIGIGLNSAHFSIINAVLLRPLPFKRSERLVVAWETNSKLSGESKDHNEVAPANLFDWQEQNQSFEEFAAFNYLGVNLTGFEEPERLSGASVSTNFFNVFGMLPLMGRTFNSEEGVLGNHRVAVISHGLWQRRFGGNSGIIDNPIILNGVNYTVIGVMPPEFDLPFPTTKQIDLWMPAAMSPAGKQDRKTHYLYVVGRLKEGDTIVQAQADMNAVARRLAEQYPDTNRDTGLRLVSLEDQVVGKIRPVVMILLGAVLLVLIIACANVANLLLMRNVVRQREIAIRTALGATRGRLVRQLLSESVVLALIGGVVGLMLAFLGVSLVKSISPDKIPRLKSLGLDSRVVGFTLLISLFTAGGFGLVPALQTSKVSITEALKEGGRGAGSGKLQARLRKFFVVFQAALALVLLISASLLIRSFVNLLNVDPGFKPDQVLTAQLSLSSGKYAQPAQQVTFFRQLIERLQAIPGVEKVGLTTALPLSDNNVTNGFTVIEHPPPAPPVEPEANYRAVSPEYFDSLGMQVLRGRGFTTTDGTQTAGVVVINESMSRQFFAHEEPIGRHLTMTDRSEGPREIIGVVKDVKHFGLDSQPQAEMFVPIYQVPYRFVTVTLKGGPNAHALTAAVRREISPLDDSLPVFNIRTMNELMSKSLSPRRFSMLLLAIFGGAALIMAAIGIYGVMAYAVSERLQEIGIRMAMGASPGNILKMVMMQAAQLAVVGVVIGILMGRLLTGVLSNLVYGINTFDIITFVSAPVFLVLMALFASYVPARRAMAVDPISMLKRE
jgi:putative ABC transport system permease protein